MQTQREESDRLLRAKTADLARQMQRDNLPCFSRFLDGRERILAQRELQALHFPQDQYCFWEGFAADVKTLSAAAPLRCMLGLFPDYLALTEGMDRSVWEEQFPIFAVTLSYREQDALTHRDLLGSLMGLDIKRELIGEILTAQDHAVVFCTQTAQQIILSELSRVGRAGVRVQPGKPQQLPPAFCLLDKTGTVSSMRLDCVVSLALNLSREKSAALIEGRQVSLNFLKKKKAPERSRWGTSFPYAATEIFDFTARLAEQKGKAPSDHQPIYLIWKIIQGKTPIR